jgi:penicillin-binding protein 2
MIRKYTNPKSDRELRERIKIFGIIVLIAFLVLIFQLFRLQILNYEYYKKQAIRNMEKEDRIPAFRGEIYSRNFSTNVKEIPIATTEYAFSLIFIPEKITEKEIKKLANLFNTTTDNIKKKIKEEEKIVGKHRKITLKSSLSVKELVYIMEHKDEFPNICIQKNQRRVYPYHNLFSHVVGYVGKINKKEYMSLRKTGLYTRNSIIGKMGVEKSYDIYLRGIDGTKKFIVDTAGRPIEERIAKEPKPGDLVVLTIDKHIQEIANEYFGDNKGSLVILKPSTGEILAMISKPDFDPQIMADKRSEIKKILNSPDKPLLNRVIQAKYPPASTFKVIMAVAGLEEHKISPSEKFQCKGYLKLKDREFKCWSEHGFVNLLLGITYSCNVYFYNVGLRLKAKNIFKWARYFGLDKKTEIDIPGEVDLSKYWDRYFLKSRWYVGDTLNLSIGQGYALATPLQMADVYSLIVNEGKVYKPHLVKEIRSPDGKKVIKSIMPKVLFEVPISRRTIKLIKEALRNVVLNGTARSLSYLPIAGKTGTVQTISDVKAEERQHAWFISFGPINKPIEKQILIVVMVEYGKHGSQAAPIAGAIFKRLLDEGRL